MIKNTSMLFSNAIFGLLTLFFAMSCQQDLTEAELGEYLDSVNAANIVGGDSPSKEAAIIPAAHNFDEGVPTVQSKGHCGDGIVDGVHEQCDKNAIKENRCIELGGIAGVVSCSEECKLDISRCITPEVNVLLGGLAENCHATCDNTPCQGGCSPRVGDPNSSDCSYACKNNCVSNCEGKMQLHVQRSEINCSCRVTSGSTFPDCQCVMGDIDSVASLSPNIAHIISNVLPVH